MAFSLIIKPASPPYLDITALAGHRDENGYRMIHRLLSPITRSIPAATEGGVRVKK
jgi:hypothetical protein